MSRDALLQPGDAVAVVAPAGPVPADLLDTGVQHLRSWGLTVRHGEHVRERHVELCYLAGSDLDRAADLRWALADPQIAAVFCARGGYGSLRTRQHLDALDLSGIDRKIFVGSSDITALHEILGARTEVRALFGPMIATESFVHEAQTREHLRRSLFEPDTVATISAASAWCMREGKARGPTVGGNLSLLAASLGGDGVSPPPPGSIALLEDVTEKPYRIDGYLTQLLRAGWFEEVAGIALGSWVDCGPRDELQAVLNDRLVPLQIPIVADLGFGHGPIQRTIPLGVEAELDADAAELRFPGA